MLEGAANYGADTASNILENTWGNKWVQLFINLSIASAPLLFWLWTVWSPCTCS